MNTLDKVLSRYVASLKLSQLPSRVVKEARIRLVDSFAVALRAFKEPPVKRIRELGSLNASSYSSTIWGSAFRVFPDAAAFSNGCALRYLDYNDTYLSKEALHPSDNIPAIVAVAEAEGRGGTEVLEGMVAAYEVCCRLADASSIRDRGWDHVTYIAVSACLGAGKALGLTQEELRNAVAIAATANVSLRQTRKGQLSMWKGFAAAHSARSGVWAALLAKYGITGPFEVFEGEAGFFKQVSGHFEIPRLGGEDSQSYKISDTSIKCHSVEYHAMTAVEAALDVREKIRRVDEIESVTLETFKVSYQIIGGEKEKWLPTTRETADHSLPYIVAATLLDGAIGPEQFEQERFSDPGVAELLRKMKIVEKAEYTSRYPVEIPNAVEVQLRDGRVVRSEASIPPGHFKKPFDEKDVSAKFRKETGRLLDERSIDEILKRAFSFEEEVDLKGFLGLLKVSN